MKKDSARPPGSSINMLPQHRIDAEGVQMTTVDPDVWSGRAVQEVFVDLADAVLHQCVRSLIGAYRGSRRS